MKRNELFERRKHKRVRVKIPVACRELLSDDIAGSVRPMSRSECVDISRGGMQIVKEKPWESPGEKLLETEFVLSGRAIRLIAHIVWNRFDAAAQKYRSGIEFIVIKNGDLESIGSIA
jgi:c-di-GMP-binding flagellar brake protein YcgR